MYTAGSSGVPFNCSPYTAGSLTSARCRIGRDLETLGHDVVGHDVPARRRRPASRSSAGRSGDVRIHGLSASTCRLAPTDRPMRSILPLFRPEITTTLPGRSRNMRSRKSGALVEFEHPARGVVLAAVERGDPLEMGVEVRALGRVDVDRRRDVGVHLLLHEPGMEVPGIERHEAKRRAGVCSNCHGKGHHTDEHDQPDAHVTSVLCGRCYTRSHESRSHAAARRHDGGYDGAGTEQFAAYSSTATATYVGPNFSSGRQLQPARESV